MRELKNALDHVPRKHLWAIYCNLPDGEVMAYEEFVKRMADIGAVVRSYALNTFDRPNYSNAECEFYNKEVK